MITRLARITCAALAASTVSAAAITTPEIEPLQNPFLPRYVQSGRALYAANSRKQQNQHGAHTAKLKLFDEFLDALRVLQDDYFQPWLGQWPNAIDWTAAVTGTHVAAALSSLSQGISAEDSPREKENLITTYFSQLLSYYFGQDAFSIRNEAYDDMLWVVLGWLETVEFIDYHATVFQLSAANDEPVTKTTSRATSGLLNQSWYGNLWIPAFSHRARIFWDIASQGWDTTLCGGGMNWNPRLEPYKNAITNELFIAASASMYLYFPGDSNTSPFINSHDPRMADPAANTTSDSREPHEMKHLQAALAGYNWLIHSGMMNEQGLYADGFHITGWNNASNPNKRCDARNDMVYTYNQGVVLTGQIGLWKVTGDERFLSDGHRLIQSTINATGYDLARDAPIDDISLLKPGQLPPWRGLGRAGVLEEQCDISGQCSQDSQSFKGIFFHHLTAFCAPLEIAFSKAEKAAHMTDSSTLSSELFKLAEESHRQACASYLGWIKLNARAALSTKDLEGKFGMWWTAGLLQINASSLADAPPNAPSGSNSIDYRTYGVPRDTTWSNTPLEDAPLPPILDTEDDIDDQVPLESGRTKHAPAAPEKLRYDSDDTLASEMAAGDPSDPNNRGRGRTVETQGGGVAVLRCLWEISQRTATTA